MKPSIGQRVRALRKERNWTTIDLHNNSGVSQSGISDIENDGRDPKLKTLQAIADAFELSLVDILPLESRYPKDKLTDDELKVMRIIDTLTQEEKLLYELINELTKDQKDHLLHFLKASAKKKKLND